MTSIHYSRMKNPLPWFVWFIDYIFLGCNMIILLLSLVFQLYTQVCIHLEIEMQIGLSPSLHSIGRSVLGSQNVPYGVNIDTNMIEKDNVMEGKFQENMLAKYLGKDIKIIIWQLWGHNVSSGGHLCIYFLFHFSHSCTYKRADCFNFIYFQKRRSICILYELFFIDVGNTKSH